MKAEGAPIGFEAFQVNPGGKRADGSPNLEEIQRALGQDRKIIMTVQSPPLHVGLESDTFIITLKKS